MPAPWRQIVAQDPAPGNTSPTGGGLFMLVPPATLAGNPLLVFSMVANLVGNKIGSVKQYVGGAATSFGAGLDPLANSTNGCASSLWHLPNPAAMGGGDKGTATGGSTTTVVDSGKAWTTNQWVGKTVKVYNKNQAAVITSNTATTLTFAGGTISAASGDKYVVGDWLELAIVDSGGNATSDDYNGAVMMELDATQGIPTGAIGSTMHHSQQGSLSAGTDNISTGSTNLGTGTVVEISAFLNDVDGGSTPYVPLAGTGWDGSATFLSFDIGQPILRIGYRTLTNPGTTDMKASAQHADHFQAHLAAFTITPPGLSGGASIDTTATGTMGARLVGAASAAVSATDALTTGIPLAGAATAASSAVASAAVKMYRLAQLIISIPKASSDSLFWGRYPQGNKPPFQGTPIISALASGVVSTTIKAAGAAAASVSATGGLTTGAGGGGGAGAPAAPTAVMGVADPLGGAIDVFFTGPDARSISPITQYTAKLYNSSGTTYQGITQSANRNATTGMTSAYIRLDGVSPGTYKVSVSATNSSGTSAEAMSASTVTVVAPSDYYVHSGNSASTSSPQNTAWSAYGGSGANSYADTTQVFPGQTNSIKVASSGLILPFYKSPWCTDPVNGNFYVKPYTHLVLKLYGASVSQEVNISFRYCSHAFGVTSSGGTNTFTDISQNLVTNGLVNGAGSIQVKGGKAMNAGAGCSNTVNTVTDTNGGGFNWSAGGGQSWIASYGDQDFAVGRTNSQPVVGGIASYCKRQRDPTTGAIVSSLTTPQPNLWNEFEIPLSAMNVYSGLAGNYQEHFYPGAIQELRVQNLNSAPIYITDFGFTVA